MDELDLEVLNCYLQEATELLTTWEKVCLDLTKNQTKESIEELFRIAHNLKGGAHSACLPDLGEFVHTIEDGITQIRDQNYEFDGEAVKFFLQAQKVMFLWVEIAKVDYKESPEYKDFILEFKNYFKSKITSTSTSSHTELNENSNNIKIELVHKKTKSNEKQAVQKNNSAKNQTLRISAEKLDLLIQSISELSIHQSILKFSKNKEEQIKIFENSMTLSEKITRHVYDQALSLRMNPLQSVFQRIERTINDLSTSLDKKIKVKSIGEEVELDKSVIERIFDPLNHIVRNAIDHGIEEQSIRQDLNKSEFGQISIEARNESNGIIIEITDDGRGIDADKVYKKALEKGLITEGQKLTQQEIFNFIFLPGFSTVSKVTDISGRGVGMDIVKKAIEELQGQIEIESTLNVGTKFIISLPTSVSIIEGLLIPICGQVYAIPIQSVDEIISVYDIQLDSQATKFKLRDQIVALYDLAECFLGQKKSNENKKTILVCKYRNQKIGFLAEPIRSLQQIVIRPFEENIKGSYALLGCTILGNGEPGLILNLMQIVEDLMKNFEESKELAS